MHPRPCARWSSGTCADSAVGRFAFAFALVLVVIRARLARLAGLRREDDATVSVGVGEGLRQRRVVRGHVTDLLASLEAAELLRDPHVERNEAADARHALVPR